MRLVALTKTTKPAFELMYKDYTAELSKYSDRVKRKEITETFFADIYSYPFGIPHLIYNDDKKLVGFFILGFDENTHPLTDYFIQEFYILNEFRRKGEGEKAVKQIFKEYPGKYCKYVLKENVGALKFWERIREKLSCEDMSKEIVKKNVPEDCLFFSFRTQKGA